jgi:hypothetical protein
MNTEGLSQQCGRPFNVKTGRLVSGMLIVAVHSNNSNDKG